MKYVVLTGEPKVWCETQPELFKSIKEAENFIRKDSKEWLKDSGALELGSHDDWCEPYYILEVKKIFQPVIKISAEVGLRNKTK